MSANIASMSLLDRRMESIDRRFEEATPEEKKVIRKQKREKDKRVLKSRAHQELLGYPTVLSRCQKLLRCLNRAFSEELEPPSLNGKKRDILQVYLNSSPPLDVQRLTKHMYRTIDLSRRGERRAEFTEEGSFFASVIEVIHFLHKRTILIGESIVYELGSDSDEERGKERKRVRMSCLPSDLSSYPKRSEYEVFSKSLLPIFHELLDEVRGNFRGILPLVEESEKTQLRVDFEKTVARIKAFVESRMVHDSLSHVYSAGLVHQPEWKASF